MSAADVYGLQLALNRVGLPASRDPLPQLMDWFDVYANRPISLPPNWSRRGMRAGGVVSVAGTVTR